MNTVLLVTFLAGSVLTEAPFPNMDSCSTARAEVLLQKAPGLNAICVYDKESKLKPNTLIKDFLTSIEKMNKCEEKGE